MSNSLKKIVNEIQYKKDWTIEQVAESIGYSRVHLNKEMNKGSNEELRLLLTEKHKDILQNVSFEIAEEDQKISLKYLAESNMKLADGHLRLIALLEQATADSQKEKMLTGDSKMRDLLELLSEIGSGKTWQSKTEALTELSKRFYGKKGHNLKVGTQND